MSIAQRLLSIADRRPPDFIIGGIDRPYLLRWWVIPRNRFFNIYLHKFLRSDDDRALHSHPWLFNASWLIAGFYREHTPDGHADRKTGDWKFRWGRAWHRVQLFRMDGGGELSPELFCWTLFITGPRVREWGFDCGGRFVHWKDFTAADGREVGKGCGA